MSANRMLITVLSALCAAGLADAEQTSVGPDPKDPTTPVVLEHGDYLNYDGRSLEAILAASGETPAPKVLSAGVDAHASAFSAAPGLPLWKHRYDRLWAGQSLIEFVGDLPVHPNVKRIFTEWSGHPRRAIVLEVHRDWSIGHRYRQDGGDEVDLGVAGLRWQAAAARAGGTPLVFYGIPWRSIASVEGKDKPWTPASYAEVLHQIETGTLNLLLTIDTPIVATWRAFALLKREHPEMDLHAPMGNWDTHLTKKDGYLAACAVAAVLLNKRPTEIPDAAQEVIFKDWDHYCEHVWGFAKKYNMTLPTRLTRAELTAIHDAVWQAKQSFDADLAKIRADAKARAVEWCKGGPDVVAAAVRSAYAKPDERDGTLDLTVSLLDETTSTAGLVALLKDAEASVRRAAARAIRRSGLRRDALRDALIAAIGAETDAPTRRDLAWTLGVNLGEDATARGFLRARAVDPAVPSEEAMAIILSTMDRVSMEDRVAFLTEVLAKRKPDNVRQRTIGLLTYAMPPPTPEILRALLSQGDEQSAPSGYIAEAPGARAVVKEAMKAHPAQTLNLARLLTVWGDLDGIDTLIRLHKEADPARRDAITKGLFDSARETRGDAEARRRLLDYAVGACKRGDLKDTAGVLDLCRRYLPVSLAHRDFVAGLVTDGNQQIAQTAKTILDAMDRAKPKP